MLDRDQLETFATVAEQQSFEKAATALHLSRGAVSQRIKVLEESLACVLLLRDKPVTPTSSGQVLLRHVKMLRLLERAALEELGPPGAPGTPVPLAIAVNADSLATWFAAVLQELLPQRGLALEVISDDQDHTSARLLRGEVMGCVSTEARAAGGCVAEPLGAMVYRCYAAPGFIQECFAKGLTLQAVLKAPAVLFNRKDALHDDFLQRVFGMRVDNYPRHYLPSPAALLEGIVMRAGYGLVPESQGEPLVREGRLIEMARPQAVPVNLYWHHWALEAPQVAALSTHVVAVARRLLGDLPSPPLPRRRRSGPRHDVALRHTDAAALAPA